MAYVVMARPRVGHPKALAACLDSDIKSRHMGVTYKNRKWSARYQVKSKRRGLGRFELEWEAERVFLLAISRSMPTAKRRGACGRSEGT